ncbi:MFS transporter [Caproicibacter sp. BJN0012]|uniref:MFS transporter n=1 Tax=Caproicibacter sp. BJN0012 TaxID=3110227 RepID=UPI002E166606|nr:MFS transporter [Caproicibacter sp. BJN0012]
MENTVDAQYRVYKRRWLVLSVYVLVDAIMQLLWATFFSITTEAWHFYGFKDQASGETAMSNLSMIVMLGMVFLSFFSIWAYDKFGWYKTVGAAAIIMAISALFRGFYGESYSAVFICTIGISIAQPFILNSFGILATKWFPPKERATVNGIGMLSIYIGVVGASLGTPYMMQIGLGIKGLLNVYGYLTAAIAVLFLLIAREQPSTPPCAQELTERVNFVEGMKLCFKRPHVVAGILIYFCLNGIYGSFTTLIEPILKYFTVSLDSMNIGTINLVLTIAGMVGTLLLPIVSDRDRLHRRLPSLKLSLVFGILGLGTFVFVHQLALIFLTAIIFGFALLGAQPVSLVLAVEAAYPASEGTSESILQWAGNVGSAVILLFINLLFQGRHSYTIIFMVAIMVVCVVIACFTKEASVSDRRLEKAEG